MGVLKSSSLFEDDGVLKSNSLGVPLSDGVCGGGVSCSGVPVLSGGVTELEVGKMYVVFGHDLRNDRGVWGMSFLALLLLLFLSRCFL